jgi:hypothetical protein
MFEVAVLPNSYILQSSSGEFFTYRNAEKLDTSYIALDGRKISDIDVNEMSGSFVTNWVKGV